MKSNENVIRKIPCSVIEGKPPLKATNKKDMLRWGLKFNIAYDEYCKAKAK